MATRKKARAPVAAPPAAMEVSLKVVVPADTPVYYSNYIEVAHSAHEIALNIVRVPTKLPPELHEHAAAGKPIELQPELQIIVPVEVARGLVAALNLQLQSFDALVVTNKGAKTS